MTGVIRLTDLLSSGPCAMYCFTKPGCPVAYFCAECRVGSRDGACERDKLREALADD